MEEETSGTCKAIGALTVDGKRVGWLRCAEPDGHHEARQWPRASGEIYTAHNGTPHSATLEWQDDAVQLDDWPEAYDADEPFDVEVPDLPDGVTAPAYDLPDGVIAPAYDPRLKRAPLAHSCLARRYQDGATCYGLRGHSGDHWRDAPVHPLGMDLHELTEPPAPVPASVIGTCLQLRPGDSAPCLLPNAHLGLHAWPVKLYG